MKTLTFAAVAIAVSVGTLSADAHDAAPSAGTEQKKRFEDAERAYHDAVGTNLPQTTSVPFDPWKDVRPENHKKSKR